jgi:hypothetical protein
MLNEITKQKCGAEKKSSFNPSRLKKTKSILFYFVIFHFDNIKMIS